MINKYQARQRGAEVMKVAAGKSLRPLPLKMTGATNVALERPSGDGVRGDRDEPAAQYGSSSDSPAEEGGFEPSVPL
jgi:hypothetical protein